MITLFHFGRALGLPDASPFCSKAEALLAISGLPFERRIGNMRKAPKGKLPVISDDGVMVADSTFIRLHLEAKHGIDFDKGLTREQRGAAWAVEKLCEDQLYWAMIVMRWLDDANFDRGPRHFFKAVPAPVRPVVIPLIRRKVRKDCHAQGMGRHSRAESALLAGRGLAAIADVLGQKPYLMGDEPCGADATVFAFVDGFLCPVFEGPERRAAESHANLVAYCQRMRERYFPDLAGASSRPERSEEPGSFGEAGAGTARP